MSDKRIILAHGLNGEIGVPTSVRKSGLPWPRIDVDMAFFQQKTAGSQLILGRKTYELVNEFLWNQGRKLFCVTSQPQGIDGAYASLEEAIAAAEADRPNRPIYIGGGAQLARRAFELLENEGAGTFYETIIQDTFPLADTYMPAFREDRWTEPEVLGDYPAYFKTRTTQRGTVLPVPMPAVRIQMRQVIPHE